MQKIFDKIKAMSLGKKIYATLWALWFAMLIVFIAVSTSLNTKIGKRDDSGYWNITQNAALGKVSDGSVVIPDKTAVMVIDKATNAQTTSAIDSIYKQDDANAIYKLGIEWVMNGNDIKDFDTNKDGIQGQLSSTNNALLAQKTGDEITGYITPTVGVTYEIKDVVQVYSFGKFEQGKLLDSSVKASNAIAGVGMGFFITMAAAVFTTVGVEVASKKGGKK